MNKAQKLNQILETLELLALNYEEQIQVLPKFVLVPDEIALIFDETFSTHSILLEELLNDVQFEHLNVVKGIFDDMDLNPYHQLWTLEALKTQKEWQNVREVARSLLNSFDHKRQVPKLSWIQYIKND